MVPAARPTETPSDVTSPGLTRHNSMVVLFSHVRTGQWASVMPAVLAETMGLGDPIRAIPIADPEPAPTVGLVYPRREPMTPLTAALVGEALKLGKAWMPA